MSSPLVLVTDPTFAVDRIREYAIVDQFPAPADGRAFTLEEVKLWLQERVADAGVLYLRGPLPVDSALLDRCSTKLKAIVTISAGYENIDVAECAKRGIRVGFAGSCLTEATAELCIGLLLSVSRRIPEAVEAAKNGNWPKNWHPQFMRGKALEGAVIGIFGMGRIGQSVAEKLATFRPKQIIYHNRRQKPECPFGYVTFGELLAQSDFLLITASASAESQGRFGAEEFGRMKNDAILVNVSRGSVVNLDDLYRVLLGGKLAGAGLDVTSPEPLPPGHPLYSMPNCVITPHIGSSNDVARSRMLAARTM